MTRRGTRIGAAAFALGLSLAGPQAAAVASAESPEAEPGPQSVGSPDRENPGSTSGVGSAQTGFGGASPKRTAATATTGPRSRAPEPETERVDGESAASLAPPASSTRRASTSTASDSTQASSLRPVTGNDDQNIADGPAATTPGTAASAMTAKMTGTGTVTTPVAGIATPASAPSPAARLRLMSGTAGSTARMATTEFPAVTTAQSTAAAATAQSTAAASMAHSVAAMTTAVGRFIEFAGNWVTELPNSPVAELLQGALLLVRRTLSSFIAATGWGHTGSQTTAAGPYLSDDELRDYLLSLAQDRYGSLFGQTVPVYNHYYEYRYLADGMAAGGPSSDTNTQVDGVDEADFVETDGRYLYVARNGALTIVDSDSTVASQTALSGYAVGQFLAGNRLTVITQNGGWYGPMARIAYGPWWNWNPQTTVTVFDVSDPGAPIVASQTVFDGAYQDARAVDGNVYLVLDRSINLPEPIYTDFPVSGDGVAPDADSAAALLGYPSKGPTVIAYRVYETWDSYVARVGDQITTLSLPHAYSVDSEGNLTDLGVIAGGGEVVRPRAEEQQSLLTVTAIDANASGAAAFATSLGSLVGSGGATVYMTPSALYLATPQDNSSGTGSSTDTRIDRFTVEGTAVDWQAGGVVTGTLINQFAMDERDGRLRVATHTLSSQFAGGTWATVEDNGVYILDTEGDSLDLIGSVTGLAPGEQLYAVRFVEDTAYLVTFLRTDPLFAIELSDPTAPTVEGELVIPGFSNYLQSVGDGLLLGIGQETEPGTWNTRMHVTLFDVSDSTNLIQIERQFLDEDAQWSWSESQFEHHAVLYSAGDGLLVVPVAASGYDPQSGAYRYETTLQVLTVDATGVTVRGVIHTDGIVSRTVRIGDVLYAIGEDHVTAYRLDDLSEVGRAPLGTGTRPTPTPILF